MTGPAAPARAEPPRASRTGPERATARVRKAARRFAPGLLAGLLLIASEGASAQQAALEPRRDIANETIALPAPAAGADRDPQRAAAPAASPGTVTGAEFGEQRIVHRNAHVEPWSASAESELFYTDNAALTDRGRQSDWYLRSGATIGYTNRIRGPFFVDLSLQQYFFRYREFDALDFDLTRFEGGLLLEAPWLAHSFFFARYRLERIAEAGFGSALLTNHVLDLGVQKIWKISRGQQVFAGLTADLALDSDPKLQARHEYSISLGYTLRLTQSVSAGLSYRGSRYEYVHQDRQDWNHIFAVGLTYDPTDWLRLSLNMSYTDNSSTASLGDYQNFVPGAGLALRLAF